MNPEAAPPYLSSQPTWGAGRPGILVFTVGLVLTTATQLRFHELPFGAGELALLGWLLGASFGQALMARKTSLSDAAMWIVGFWLVAWASLIAGAFWSSLIGMDALDDMVHDFAALAFVTLVSIGFALVFRESRPLESMLHAYVFLTSAIVGGMLVLSWFVPTAFGLSLWYYEGRFAAWAINPNQIALLVVGIPFWALHLHSQSGRSRRVLLEFSVLVSILVGLATYSEALLLAWLGGFGLLGLMAIYKSPVRGHGRVLLAWICIPLGGIILATVLAPVVWPTFVNLYHTDGGQGDVRMALWGNGLQAIAMSPVFGFGPGAHAGLESPFQGEEAHNTLIDWGTCAGVVGVAAYLSLVWVVVRRSWRAGNSALVCGFFALFTFSLFHYVLRQPIFWVSLLIVLLLSPGEPALKRH